MTSRQKSRPWDPTTIALSDNGLRLVESAVEAQIRARFDRQESIGKMARRNSGPNLYKEQRTVGALILDALAHHLCDVPEPLVIRLDKNWLSGGPPEVTARNRTVNDRVYDLEQAGWLEVNRSGLLNNRYVTELGAGPALVDAAKLHSVSVEDIGVEQAPAEVELRGVKPANINEQREVIAFTMTPLTLGILDRLHALNDCLHRARLGNTLAGDVRIDLRCRQVSRTFLDGSFERGGRLAGSAFWLNLRKDVRRSSLTIDGEPIAEIDIQAAMPSIAYALEGIRPDFDPYTLRSPLDIPRDAVKICLMQMLWKPITRRSRLSPGARSAVPTKYVAGQVFEFIRRHNEPIAHRLGAPIPCGAELMWHESEIIIAATIACYRAGFSALPLHDALLVPCSQATVAASLLSGAFEERLGVAPTIKSELFDGSAAEETLHA